MPEYRKRPVVIEAMQWDGSLASAQAVVEWGQHQLLGCTELPGGLVRLQVTTLEGVLLASPGDWIIRGVQGEFYPCKPDIFAATYEAAS